MAKKKNKLPKKIGGFKVPRPVRKSPLLSKLLASQLGRDILANAITAGAGAAAAVLVQERQAIADGSTKAVKEGTKKSKRAVGIASDVMQSAATAMMGVVADAAKNFIPPKAKKKSGRATAH